MGSSCSSVDVNRVVLPSASSLSDHDSSPISIGVSSPPPTNSSLESPCPPCVPSPRSPCPQSPPIPKPSPTDPSFPYRLLVPRPPPLAPFDASLASFDFDTFDASSLRSDSLSLEVDIVSDPFRLFSDTCIEMPRYLRLQTLRRRDDDDPESTLLVQSPLCSYVSLRIRYSSFYSRTTLLHIASSWFGRRGPPHESRFLSTESRNAIQTFRKMYVPVLGSPFEVKLQNDSRSIGGIYALRVFDRPEGVRSRHGVLRTPYVDLAIIESVMLLGKVGNRIVSSEYFSTPVFDLFWDRQFLGPYVCRILDGISGRSLLHYACHEQDEDLVKAILRCLRDPDQLTDEELGFRRSQNYSETIGIDMSKIDSLETFLAWCFAWFSWTKLREFARGYSPLHELFGRRRRAREEKSREGKMMRIVDLIVDYESEVLIERIRECFSKDEEDEKNGINLLFTDSSNDTFFVLGSDSSSCVAVRDAVMRYLFTEVRCLRDVSVFELGVENGFRGVLQPLCPVVLPSPDRQMVSDGLRRPRPRIWLNAMNFPVSTCLCFSRGCRLWSMAFGDLSPYDSPSESRLPKASCVHCESSSRRTDYWTRPFTDVVFSSESVQKGILSDDVGIIQWMDQCGLGRVLFLRSSIGRSLFHEAARIGSIRIVSALLELELCPDVPNNFPRLLERAWNIDSLRLSRLSISMSGFTLFDDRFPWVEYTPSYGMLRVPTKLICDVQWRTPFHVAVRSNEFEVCDLLIDSCLGHAFTVADCCGRTLLHSAAERSDLRVFLLLLDRMTVEQISLCLTLQDRSGISLLERIICRIRYDVSWREALVAIVERQGRLSSDLMINGFQTCLRLGDLSSATLLTSWIGDEMLISILGSSIVVEWLQTAVNRDEWMEWRFEESVSCVRQVLEMLERHHTQVNWSIGCLSSFAAVIFRLPVPSILSSYALNVLRKLVSDDVEEAFLRAVLDTGVFSFQNHRLFLELFPAVLETENCWESARTEPWLFALTLKRAVEDERDLTSLDSLLQSFFSSHRRSTRREEESVLCSLSSIRNLVLLDETFIAAAKRRCFGVLPLFSSLIPKSLLNSETLEEEEGVEGRFLAIKGDLQEERVDALLTQTPACEDSEVIVSTLNRLNVPPTLALIRLSLLRHRIELASQLLRIWALRTDDRGRLISLLSVASRNEGFELGLVRIICDSSVRLTRNWIIAEPSQEFVQPNSFLPDLLYAFIRIAHPLLLDEDLKPIPPLVDLLRRHSLSNDLTLQSSFSSACRMERGLSLVLVLLETDDTFDLDSITILLRFCCWFGGDSSTIFSILSVALPMFNTCQAYELITNQVDVRVPDSSRKFLEEIVLSQTRKFESVVPEGLHFLSVASGSFRTQRFLETYLDGIGLGIDGEIATRLRIGAGQVTEEDVLDSPWWIRERRLLNSLISTKPIESNRIIGINRGDYDWKSVQLFPGQFSYYMQFNETTAPDSPDLVPSLPQRFFTVFLDELKLVQNSGVLKALLFASDPIFAAHLLERNVFRISREQRLCLLSLLARSGYGAVLTPELSGGSVELRIVLTLRTERNEEEEIIEWLTSSPAALRIACSWSSISYVRNENGQDSGVRIVPLYRYRDISFHDTLLQTACRKGLFKLAKLILDNCALSYAHKMDHTGNFNALDLLVLCHLRFACFRRNEDGICRPITNPPTRVPSYWAVDRRTWRLSVRRFNPRDTSFGCFDADHDVLIDQFWNLFHELTSMGVGLSERTVEILHDPSIADVILPQLGIGVVDSKIQSSFSWIRVRFTNSGFVNLRPGVGLHSTLTDRNMMALYNAFDEVVRLPPHPFVNPGGIEHCRFFLVASPSLVRALLWNRRCQETGGWRKRYFQGSTRRADEWGLPVKKIELLYDFDLELLEQGDFIFVESVDWVEDEAITRYVTFDAVFYGA